LTTNPSCARRCEDAEEDTGAVDVVIR